MRASIAELAGVTADAIHVKGKTFEGLGAMAEGRAVQAWAVCLLGRSERGRRTTSRERHVEIKRLLLTHCGVS